MPTEGERCIVQGAKQMILLTLRVSKCQKCDPQNKERQRFQDKDCNGSNSHASGREEVCQQGERIPLFAPSSNYPSIFLRYSSQNTVLRSGNSYDELMSLYRIVRPSWLSATLELYEGEKKIGEMVMLKKWSYALAEAKMPDSTVRFGYKGWNMRKAFIQDAEGKDIASVKNLSWWKYDFIVTIDGTDYTLKQKTWSGMQYGWYRPNGSEIMELRMNWRGKTEVESPAPLNKTEMLLLFFHMYLLRLAEAEAAAAT